MEYNSYLDRIARTVRYQRRLLEMNQVEFYRFLFPNDNKEEENIKKKMNAIENCKLKHVDFDFLITLCEKCGVSADYLLNRKVFYQNHEIEMICNYTGLSQESAIILHELKIDLDNNADLSLLKCGAIINDNTDYKKVIAKSNATILYEILNYLFTKRDSKKYSKINDDDIEYNLSILYDIYKYCIAKPELISGTTSENLSDFFDHEANKLVTIDANKYTTIKDSGEVWYPFDTRRIFKQFAKEDLLKDLDKLSKQYEIDQNNK